ncbi:MAG: diguanylate cyclase [Mycobacteriaceae bacterium]
MQQIRYPTIVGYLNLAGMAWAVCAAVTHGTTASPVAGFGGVGGSHWTRSGHATVLDTAHVVGFTRSTAMFRYHAQQIPNLSQHPGFVAVSSEHEQVHKMAARMLVASFVNEPIPVRDYEGFVNAATRMRAEMLGLRNELENRIANLDPPTGATSRIGMLTRLRAQQETVKRDLHSCTITMMDLDLFKSVNDGYGHQAGDIVLVETMRYVMTHLRPHDEFFRYGGEEFWFCAPGTDLEAGRQAVERVREGLAAIPIDVGDGRVLRISASFGVTLLDPDVPVEESIARADHALYQAKAAGRNQSRIWDPSIA